MGKNKKEMSLCEFIKAYFGKKPSKIQMEISEKWRKGVSANGPIGLPTRTFGRPLVRDFIIPLHVKEAIEKLK